MANRWGIPQKVEDFVKQRDTVCVYCGIKFSAENNSRKSKPSWEHIVNDIRINSAENIALCCMSCNASKGAKRLEDWLLSDYCRKKEITVNSVAYVVKMALVNPPRVINNLSPPSTALHKAKKIGNLPDSGGSERN